MDIRKLSLRTLSGLIYCLLIVGCIAWGEEGIIVLASVLSVMACLEFASISQSLTKKNIPTLLLDIAGCICLCLGFLGYPLVIWLAVMIFRGIEELYICSEHPLKNLAHSMMSQIYIGVPMGLMTAIAWILHPTLLLAIFLFIWINDTGAYLVGCTIGRHKMFPRISPKKTWEGFIGGLILTLAFSLIFYKYGNDFFGMSIFHAGYGVWIGLAMIVVIFGTFGDLIESMIKRNLNIKDSGNIMPGHGGILDRIDSLLMAVPASAVYFSLLISALIF